LPGSLLTLASGNAEATFWALYSLSLAWDGFYLWNGLQAAVSLEASSMGIQVAQCLMTAPMLLLRAQHFDPLANGALAAMRVCETCLLVHNVAPLLVGSKSAKAGRRPRVETTAVADDDDTEGSSGWESPKHRPWKSAAVERDALRLDDGGGETAGGTAGEDAPYHDLKVVFGYAPADERMLELREGEMVRVVAEQDGWFFAIDCEGNEGFVPPNYLEQIAPEIDTEVMPDVDVSDAR